MKRVPFDVPLPKLATFLGDEDRQSRERMVRHLRDLREPERLSLAEVARRQEEPSGKAGYISYLIRKIKAQPESEVVDFRAPHLTRAVVDKR